MKSPKYIYVILFLFLLIPNKGFSQFSCLVLDAGADVNLDCTQPCTDLTASIIGLPSQNTSSYIIADPVCPLPPISGGTVTSIDADDEWSNAINLPFEFTYYENTYNQIVVGGNGQVSFDITLAGGYNGWGIDPADIIPVTNGNFPLNTIYGAFHDLDVSVTGDPTQINYFESGTAPYRVFVVSFDNVSHFSCNNLQTSQQIVLYESLNVIEVNIIDKPSCTTWNDGLATLAIMGNNLTQFAVPPGRNTSVWTAQDETWRFIPDGPQNPNTTIEWLDPAGIVIGNDLTVNVCPTSGSSTYTVQITFQLPDGTFNTITDEVIVNSTAAFTVDLGPDIDTCSTDPIILDASADAPAGATYEWFLDGVSQGPASTLNPTYTVTFPNSGTYSVDVIDPTDPTCTASDSVIINLTTPPQIASPPIDIYQCDNGTNPGIFDLTVNTPIILGGQDPLIYEVKYYTTLVDSQNDTNQILTPAAYPIATPPQQTIYVRIYDIATNTCFSLSDFIIDFSPVSIGTLTDYDACDADTDGFVDLNLPLIKDNEALNGLDPLQFTVTYHGSQADADNNVGTYPNPYTVAAPSEIIFVRVENNATPTCFATDSFEVFVTLSITAIEPTPYILCDEFPNDGLAEFDLTTT